MIRGATIGRFGAVAIAVLTMIGLATPLQGVPEARAQTGSVRVEWLGWSHFRFTSPNGKVVLTNPYITGNPDAAVSLDDITQADLIVVADGHGDEVGDSVAIAQKTGAKVYGPSRVIRRLVELGLPADQGIGGNQGDRLRFQGITVRQVFSVHDSSFREASPTTPFGGPASGFVITFENNWTVYFTGSSAATSDQALWGAMYKPDAMIFHMSGPHDPLDVAMSIKLLSSGDPNLTTIMPHHHRVTPGATDTRVEEVQANLESLGVSLPITNQVRSQVYEFTK